MRSAGEIREVWAWNFEREFRALLSVAAGGSSVVALDTEFPGVLREGPWWSGGSAEARAAQYEALRCNVNLLRPIQLGIAVATPRSIPGAPDMRGPSSPPTGDLVIRGVWSFNLHFDVFADLHTEASVAFLAAAGVNFRRHAVEGINAAMLGRYLAASLLVGPSSPAWVTFAGLYDLGYLLKLLGGGDRPLPRYLVDFDAALAKHCPRRHELRDWLPHGSLESLAQEHGVRRRGTAHTAGSDALVTLELFIRAIPEGDRAMLVSEAQVAAAAAAAGAQESQDEACAAPLRPSSAWGASARWAMIGAAAATEAAPGAALATRTRAPWQEGALRPMVTAA